MSDTAKKNPFVTAKNFVVQHKTHILITTTVVSITAAVLMRQGIAQHNAFLKEHGLYEQFYNIEAATQAG